MEGFRGESGYFSNSRLSPGGRRKVRLSSNGGLAPVWSAGEMGGVAVPRGYIHTTPGQSLHVPLDDEGRPQPSGARPIVEMPGTQLGFPALSPDGRWLAYLSDESGAWEVYVASYPDAAVKRTVSVAGGRSGAGARTETRTSIASVHDGTLFEAEPALALGRPRVVLEGPFINVPGYSWDISPDGERFLVIENPDAGRALTELVVVHNFFDELRRRVPLP